MDELPFTLIKSGVAILKEKDENFAICKKLKIEF